MKTWQRSIGSGKPRRGDPYWHQLLSFSDGTFVPGHQFTYTFDDIGNRIGMSKGGNPSGGGLDSISYTANNLNQYTVASTPGHLWVTGEADADSQAFVNGNWVWRKGTFLAKDITASNGSAPVNQPVTVSSKLLGVGTAGATLVQESAGDLLVPQSSGTPQYDADGNLTDDDLWVHTWNAENRLTQMVSDTDVASAAKRKLVFTYDCQGRRIGKAVYTWDSSDYHTTPSTSLLYVYDGLNLIAELDSLNSNVVERSYVWGPDVSGSLQEAGGIGGLLSVYVPRESGSPTVFTCYDANANISGLVKASDASLVGVYEYGPFGEPLRSTGALAKANLVRFGSKYADEYTGLIYYGYRFYNPSTGRWQNRDPIEESGGFNLYEMVGNAPVNRWDYLGLATYFAIYYGTSGPFKQAAETFKKEREASSTFNPACDVVFLKSVTTEADFIRVWGEIKTDAEARFWSFPNDYKIAEGAIFSHASLDGLEWAPNPGAFDGTFDGSEIRTLSVLPWADGSFLSLHGCKSGLAAATNFAKGQGVVCRGENAKSYFSESDTKYIQISKSSKNVYLRAFRRFRNIKYTGGWDDGPVNRSIHKP